MIDNLAEYLRSVRTLSQAEVDERALSRGHFDFTPGERLENAVHCPHDDARH